jgi:flagellar assembly factor FliW
MTTAAHPMTDQDDVLLVPTRLFGPISVPKRAVLTFADGLLGFGGERQFALLPSAMEGLFWLQDIHRGDLAFLMLDPYRFFDNYHPDLPPDAVADGDSHDERALLCTVTLSRRDQEPCTANLQAPVLLDLVHHTGRQVILEGTAYQTRHAVVLEPLAA